MLFSLRNLFMKENQYEQAIGSQERYYVKISNFTLKNRHIDTKKKKKNRLYLLKNICKKALTNIQVQMKLYHPGDSRHYGRVRERLYCL